MELVKAALRNSPRGSTIAEIKQVFPTLMTANFNVIFRQLKVEKYERICDVKDVLSACYVLVETELDQTKFVMTQHFNKQFFELKKEMEILKITVDRLEGKSTVSAAVIGTEKLKFNADSIKMIHNTMKETFPSVKVSYHRPNVLMIEIEKPKSKAYYTNKGKWNAYFKNRPVIHGKDLKELIHLWEKETPQTLFPEPLTSQQQIDVVIANITPKDDNQPQLEIIGESPIAPAPQPEPQPQPEIIVKPEDPPESQPETLENIEVPDPDDNCSVVEYYIKLLEKKQKESAVIEEPKEDMTFKDIIKEVEAQPAITLASRRMEPPSKPKIMGNRTEIKEEDTEAAFNKLLEELS